MFCKNCYKDPCRYSGEDPRTTHNIPASPRLARLYRVLHEQGIGLVDWSTDDDIARQIGRLKAFLIEVETVGNIEGLPENFRQ